MTENSWGIGCDHPMSISTVNQVSTLTFDELLNGARYHADAALTAYSNQDERAILFNAAISMEQLSKALLFSMHPALLAEVNNGKFDSLLHLTGFGHKADRLSVPKTIGAKAALIRVRQIMDVKTPKTALDQLIDVRDGVLHAGLLDAKSTRELLTAFLRYAEELYDALEERQAWGDDRWSRWDQLVASLITQSLTEVEHEITRKIEAARANHRAFMDQVPEPEQEAVAASLQIRSWTLDEREMGGTGPVFYGLENMNCPACGVPRRFRTAADGLITLRAVGSGTRLRLPAESGNRALNADACDYRTLRCSAQPDVVL